MNTIRNAFRYLFQPIQVETRFQLIVWVLLLIATFIGYRQSRNRMSVKAGEQMDKLIGMMVKEFNLACEIKQERKGLIDEQRKARDIFKS